MEDSTREPFGPSEEAPDVVKSSSHKLIYIQESLQKETDGKLIATFQKLATNALASESKSIIPNLSEFDESKHKRSLQKIAKDEEGSREVKLVQDPFKQCGDRNTDIIDPHSNLLEEEKDDEKGDIGHIRKWESKCSPLFLSHIEDRNDQMLKIENEIKYEPDFEPQTDNQPNIQEYNRLQDRDKSAQYERKDEVYPLKLGLIGHKFPHQSPDRYDQEDYYGESHNFRLNRIRSTIGATTYLSPSMGEERYNQDEYIPHNSQRHYYFTKNDDYPSSHSNHFHPTIQPLHPDIYTNYSLEPSNRALTLSNTNKSSYFPQNRYSEYPLNNPAFSETGKMNFPSLNQTNFKHSQYINEMNETQTDQSIYKPNQANQHIRNKSEETKITHIDSNTVVDMGMRNSLNTKYYEDRCRNKYNLAKEEKQNYIIPIEKDESIFISQPTYNINEKNSNISLNLEDIAFKEKVVSKEVPETRNNLLHAEYIQVPKIDLDHKQIFKENEQINSEMIDEKEITKNIILSEPKELIDKKLKGNQTKIEEEVKDEIDEEEDDDDFSESEYYSLQKKVEFTQTCYEEFVLEANLSNISIEILSDEKEFLKYIAPLFFTLLKKHHIWDKVFINTIKDSIEDKVNIIIWEQISSKLFLYSFLNSANTELRIKILSDYASFAPVPLLMSTWRDDFTDVKYQINQELLWIIEDSYLVVSFSEEQEILGKSSYLNYLFNTEFFAKNMPKELKGTIDLYFDAFKGTSLQIAIADINSESNHTIAQKLIKIADMLIIHVNSKKTKQKEFEENIFKKYSKPIIFIYRDAPEKILRNNSKLYEKRSNDIPILTQKLPVINLIEQNDRNFQTHIDNVLTFVFQHLSKCKHNSLNKFSFLDYFFPKNIPESHKFTEYLTKYDKLIQHVRNNKKVLNTNKFLAMVPKHTEWCLITSKMYHDSSGKETAEDFDELAKQKSYLENEIKDQARVTPKLILELFLEMASFKESTSFFFIEIAKMIKKIIDTEIKNYRDCYNQLKEYQLEIKCQGEKEFTEFILTEYESINNFWEKNVIQLCKIPNLNKDSSKYDFLDNLNDSLMEIDRLIIQKSFSLEILWRELIYFNEFQPKNPIFENYDIEDFFLQNLRYGYPFEIIDGDNLYFSSRFFKEVMFNLSEKILVLSVIGPQSSGKSTLLNFLFGCNFQTSAGRCTRGIYGTYIRLKNCPKYDGVLILDTEGLLSIHHSQINMDFDRKITLFILAVSQVVIINVKGEMTGPLLELLTVCIQSLAELKENKVPCPEIFMVLNQYTDLNTENIQKDINSLKEQMGDILREKDIGLNDLVKLEKKNISALPNAFNQFSRKIKGTQEIMNYKIPYFEFVQKTKKLAKLLINMAIQNQKNNSSNLPYDNLSRWFDNAGGIWDVIKTYPTLVYFKNITQIRENDEMKGWINHEIQHTLEQKEVKLHILKEFETKLADLNSIKEVSFEIQSYFDPIEKRLLSTFEARFKNLKYNEKGILDSKFNFEVRLKRIAIEWENKIKGYFMTNSNEKSRKYGQTRLNQKKLELFAKKANISEEEAKIAFELEWDAIIYDMSSRLDRWTISISLLAGIIKTYSSVYDMLPELTCHELVKNYQNQGYLNISYSILNTIYQFSEPPFVINGFKPRSAQDSTYSKKYINLNNMIIKGAYTTFIPKILFLDLINFTSLHKEVKSHCGILTSRNKATNIVFEEFIQELQAFKINFTKEGFNLLIANNPDKSKIVACMTQNYYKNIQNQEINILKSLEKKYIPMESNNKGKFKNKKYFNMETFEMFLQSDILAANSKLDDLFIFTSETSIDFTKEFKINYQLTINQNFVRFQWLFDLYVKKIAPPPNIRIQFARKEFNWRLLIKEIINVIKNKLFLQNTLIVRDFETNLIAEIANEMNKIIEEANDSLSQFGLQLNQNSIAKIHICVLLCIWRGSEEKQWIELETPIIEMKKSKDKEWKDFKAVLFGNYEESCRTVARNLFAKIEGNYISHIIEKIKINFENYLNEEGYELCREAIQDEVDSEYMFKNKGNIDKGLEYLNNFLDIILERFDRKWYGFFETFQDKENKAILEKARLFFNDIESKVVDLKTALDERKFNSPSSMLFAVKDIFEGDRTQFDPELGQAGMLYFFDYICGKNTKSWIIRKLTISAHPDIESLPIPISGISSESLAILKSEYFEQEIVSRLDLLCVFFIDELQKSKQTVRQTNFFDVDLIASHCENKKLLMKNLARGCDIKCPTCHRCCDVVHGNKIAGSKESPHACQKGHQVRALSGNKLYNNEASVFTCEEMVGNDSITYKGERMIWNEFINTIEQSMIANWNFKELLNLKANNQINNIKYKDFWKLIGEEYCKAQTNDGNEMKMSQNSNKHKLNIGFATKIHAILVLDSSGNNI